MSQTVASILVDVLEKIGVTHIFGLIADSLNPIGDAVRHSKIAVKWQLRVNGGRPAPSNASALFPQHLGNRN